MDIHTIQRLMGHGHISSTLRYFHLARTRRHPFAAGAARTPRHHATRSAVRAPAQGARGGQIELADIVRAHGAAFSRHASAWRCATARASRHRALPHGGPRRRDLANATCAGQRRYLYHSCRNRHCPKCQRLAKERWLAARRAELLPVPYFHLVFTLPHELNALAQGNPRALYATALRRRRPDTARVRPQPALGSGARSPPRWCYTPGARRSPSTCTCMRWSPPAHSPTRALDPPAARVPVPSEGALAGVSR